MFSSVTNDRLDGEQGSHRKEQTSGCDSVMKAQTPQKETGSCT